MRIIVAGYKQVMEEQRDRVIDLAEGKLIDAITDGQPWAISLVLKTLGKKRGYIERQEVEHAGSIGGTYVIDIGGDGHDSE